MIEHQQEQFEREPGLILLTGATGYVGGRLLQALEQRQLRVRCLARRPEFLKPKVGAGTEIVSGNVLDRTSLEEAMRGVTVAYYLVHSMGSSGSFEENDRNAARNFGAAAKPPASGASSISADSEMIKRRCPRICAAARRWERFCASPAWRCSNFVRRSSLGQAAFRSK